MPVEEEWNSLPLYENRYGVFACHRSRDLTFPPHLHPDLELVFIEKGKILLQEGGKDYLLHPGDCAVVFPGRIHSFETQGESCMLLALCPTEMAGEFRRTLLRCIPDVPVVVERKLHPNVGYAMRGLREIFSQGGSLPAARAFVQLILARVIPCMEMKENTDTPPADLTAQVIGWISENYAEPVSLDILAEKLQVSKYRMSRVFGEKLHTSLSEYVNRLRIDHAQALLQATEEDVLSICRACGYENPRTFNREFKRICGCTPREYRHNAQAAKQESAAYERK